MIHCIRIFLLLIFLAISVIPALPQSSGSYTITGEIRDSAGNLIPGARACYTAASDKRGWRCIPSDSNGRFVIRPNLENRYILRPGSVPVRPDPKRHLPLDRYAAFAAVEVTLDSDNREAHVDLQLPPKNGMLFVTVVDTLSNSPVELIRVHVCPAEFMLQCGGLPLRSDTGEFKIYTPLYPFNIRIGSPDHEEWVYFGDKESVIDSGTSSYLHVELKPLSKVFAINTSNVTRQYVPLLPAPVQLAPSEGARLAGYPRTTTLKWDEVADAAAYAVEVDFCQSSQKLKECLNPAPLVFPPGKGKSPWPNRIEDTTFTFDFVGAQPGRWRVWAIDKNGQKGRKSPWRMFFYAR